MTTFEPGARLALTQGLVLSPRSTAFLASRPAATITEGFDVLVQLVIAAITTEPCVIGAGVSVVIRDFAARRRRSPSRPLRRRIARGPASEAADGCLGGPGRLQLFEGRLKRLLRFM